MPEDKNYDEIIASLQETIDARKEQERIEAIKDAVSAELTSFGYKDGGHETMLEILEPFLAGYESEEIAKEEVLKLHHVVIGVAASKKSNSIFK